MDAEREERLRRRALWRNVTAVAGVVLALLTHFTKASAWLPFVIPVVAVAFVVTMVSLVRDRRTRRRIREGREGQRWPLGEPYQLQFERRGIASRRAGELHVGEEELTILVDFAQAVAIEFADVRSVRVRLSSIDVETGHEVLVLVPATYADRQRLLWELAVRCPDAMERGMDADAERTKPGSAPPAAVPAPSEDAARPATGLALGSALAGPMESGNPAPPRKSGLGVGLFVPPPGSKPDSEM